MTRPNAIELGIGGVLALAVAACATAPRPTAPDNNSGPEMVAADIRDAGGRGRAQASATQIGGDVRLRIEALGIAPGAYGVHVHEIGRCDPPGFSSAGAHWNPGRRQHGKDNSQGMHRGDLPNLLVGTDGRGTFEITIPDAMVSGAGANALVDADGAAIVIHAAPDDYRTDPSGNSGARIACGVLG